MPDAEVDRNTLSFPGRIDPPGDPPGVAHPSPEQLRAFGLGRLPAADWTAVERHFESCASCLRVLNDLPRDAFVSALQAAAGANAPTATHAGDATDPDFEDLVPAELAAHPRYTLGALIGRGGMGAVYKAEHALMERPVALKVIAPKYLANPEAAARFRQEVKAAARLQHPNIVTAFDAEEVGRLTVLVMEYVEGRSLADHLKECGPLPAAEACGYAAQAALGLAHAHAAGMVHRDVKPHNLMLTPDGRVKILDFGLARLTSDVPAVETAPDPSAATTQTRTGACMGTPDYMAPEQAAGPARADARSDTYALGATLFHMLAGRVPFPGGTVAGKLHRLAHTAPPPLGALRPDLPPALVGVVERMMAKRPADRFPTAAAVAAALAAFASPAPPRKKRRALIAAGFSLAALVAVVWRVGERPATPAPAEPQPPPPGVVAPARDGRFLPRADWATRFPAFTADGRRLLIPDGNTVTSWDVRTGHQLGTFTGWEDRVMVARQVGTTGVVGMSSTGQVVGWDAATNEKVAGFVVPDCQESLTLAVLPKGDRVALPAKRGTVTIREWPGGREAVAVQLPGPEFVFTLAASPCGRWLAITCGHGRTYLADPATGRVRVTLPAFAVGTRDFATCGFSPDGQLFAVGTLTKLRVWKTADWTAPPTTIDGNASGLAAFDTHGCVTTANVEPLGGTTAVTRWDARTGVPLGRWEFEHRQPWNHLGLSPDGRTLAMDVLSRRGFVLIDLPHVAPPPRPKG